ncbi:MAG: hypothetical protein WKF50_01060 [Nocardioides sp.]
MRLIDELNELYASYVHAINAAVAGDDVARAERLAEGYDEDAIRLIAEREGKTHLLPIQRPAAPETPLRRLVARLRLARAA